MSEHVTGFEQAVAMALNLSPLDKVRLVEQVMATLEQDLTTSQKKAKRSLYGLWSGVSVSADDIGQARQEMWGKFPHEDV